MTDRSGGAVWTLRQINQARALRAKAHVADEVLHKYRKAAEAATRDELFKTLRNLARPYAIEFDARDLEFFSQREPEAPSTVIMARWHPSTNACEIYGGPYDGQVLAHQRPGEPLRLPTLAPLPTLVEGGDATCAETALTELVVTYVLAGWSEKHRRWVYEASR